MVVILNRAVAGRVESWHVVEFAYSNKDDAKHADDPSYRDIFILIDHTTTALKLLYWLSIRPSVELITQNENYVMQGEENGDLLSL